MSLIEVASSRDHLNATTHHMPEAWLRARVRGWMDLIESPGMDWWLGTFNNHARWICGSSRDNTYAPTLVQIDLAQRVCRFINRECAHGGVWFAGFVRDGEFYMMFKDSDGDIQLPIEFNPSFEQLLGWSNEDFAEHCEQAHALYVERHKRLEKTKGQDVKLAQGEQPSAEHDRIGPAIAGMEIAL